jgi:hypothetical protein
LGLFFELWDIVDVWLGDYLLGDEYFFVVYVIIVIISVVFDAYFYFLFGAFAVVVGEFFIDVDDFR